jgi:flagellar biosynthesis protein FliP
MSNDEDSDYGLWVQLANDPSQSEEARQQYRAKMEAYIHEKLREAFQFAANQTSPGSTNSAPTASPPAKS